jgi:hypothetical protein
VPVTVGSLIDIALVPKAHDAWDSTVFTTAITGPVGGNLTLGGGAAVAADVNLAGNLVYAGGASAATISGNLALNGAAARTIDVADGAAASDVVLGGALTGGGSVTKTGPGVLAIAGAQNWSAGSSMTIQGGGVRFDTNAGGQFHARNLAVDAAGGDVTFTATQHLASLTVGAGRTATLAAGGGKAIDVSALALAGSTNAWTGTLDVADNMLIVHASDAEREATLARLQNQARTALNQSGALWTGAGLTSSAAAADPQHLHALGIVPVGEVYGLGPGQTMIFRGQTVTDDSIVVGYTYFGDADLNGVVDLDDVMLMEFALQSGESGWLFGDFNYDGVVDRDNDYAILLDSIHGQGAPISSAMRAVMDRIEARAVPEPSALGAAGVVAAIAGVTRRRRRRFERATVAGSAEQEMARVIQ